MRHYNYYRIAEESNYSKAEDLRMQLQKCTDPVEREAIEEELEGLDENEHETFTQSLYRIFQ